LEKPEVTQNGYFTYLELPHFPPTTALVQGTTSGYRWVIQGTERTYEYIQQEIYRQKPEVSGEDPMY
jgi:hypothetical protein